MDCSSSFVGGASAMTARKASQPFGSHAEDGACGIGFGARVAPSGTIRYWFGRWLALQAGEVDRIVTDVATMAAGGVIGGCAYLRCCVRAVLLPKVETNASIEGEVLPKRGRRQRSGCVSILRAVLQAAHAVSATWRPVVVGGRRFAGGCVRSGRPRRSRYVSDVPWRRRVLR